MSDRLFMSVPDGPYWAAKEKRERDARDGAQPGMVDPVRGIEARGSLEGERGPDNER